MSKDRTRFWIDQSRWPRDAEGHVFLCRCVSIVGHYLFGDEWTGSEAFAPPPYNFVWQPGKNLLPLTQSLASYHQKNQLHALLAWRRPDLGIALARIGIGGSRELPHLSEQQWSIGLEEAKKFDTLYAPALERFQQAQGFIVSALAEGRLRAALRPIAGGAFSAPLAPHLWNGDDLSARFCWGQMNPNDPFSTAVGGEAFEYIYIEKRSLDGLMNPIVEKDDVSAAPSGVPSGHFDGIAIGRSPMELPVWSFGIAVAWIMCKSPKMAAEYWTGPLDIALALKIPGAMSFDEAQSDLVRRLASGALKATATDAGGDIRGLEAHEWRHLTPQPDGGNNGLKIRLWRPGGGIGGTSYDDVRLVREDVLAIWPQMQDGKADLSARPEDKATPHQGSVATTSRPASEATIRRAIEAGAGFAVDRGVTPPTRSEHEEILGKVYKGTAREKIRGVFAEDAISSLLPPKNGPRGPRNPNRNKEIEEIRQFLSAAELRN